MIYALYWKPGNLFEFEEDMQLPAPIPSNSFQEASVKDLAGL
jgi:hypothetical protein